MVLLKSVPARYRSISRILNSQGFGYWTYSCQSLRQRGCHPRLGSRHSWSRLVSDARTSSRVSHRINSEVCFFAKTLAAYLGWCYHHRHVSDTNRPACRFQNHMRRITRNHAYVRSLGADVVLDRSEEPLKLIEEVRRATRDEVPEPSNLFCVWLTDNRFALASTLLEQRRPVYVTKSYRDPEHGVTSMG